jgi:hypothetical protein
MAFGLHASAKRPKQGREDYQPSYAPGEPSGVWVSRLPFKNFLMDGHQLLSPRLRQRSSVANFWTILFGSGASDKLERVAAGAFGVGGDRTPFQMEMFLRSVSAADALA